MSSLYCTGPNGLFGIWYGFKDGTRDGLSGSNIAGSSANLVHCLTLSMGLKSESTSCPACILYLCKTVHKKCKKLCRLATGVFAENKRNIDHMTVFTSDICPAIVEISIISAELFT
eukprot:TRINITY_DN27989_c1_g2_i1.p1 TRINITY_DN27989_c1_g2~~TRINITY_DN27989_c1_g2_i1.p1  ORF type:complete len:116 (+),score=7.26 TRINITY_DN27989_c1_g2_i1:201-548(+)